MDGEETREKLFSARYDHTPKGVFALASYSIRDGDDVTFADDGKDPRQRITNEENENVSLSKPKKSQRPPNLDLSPSSLVQQQHNVTLQPCPSDPEPELSRESDFEQSSVLCSTPAKHSGSVSEKVSLVLKKTLCE